MKEKDLELLDDHEYFGVQEYIIMYNTQKIGAKVKTLPSDGCLHQESQEPQKLSN